METRRILVLLGLVATLGTLAACGPSELDFTVEFAEAEGLEPGDPVVYRGLEVGRVRAVSLADGGVRADLELDGEHREAIYREADFTLERTVTGGRKIVIYDTAGPRTRMAEGDLVRGGTTSLGALADKLGALGRDLLERGAEKMGTQLDDWRRQLDDSDAGETFLEGARGWMGRGSDMTAERWHEFRADELPKLRRKAEGVRDWLVEQGREADAKKFWDDFESWVRGLDERFSESE